MFGLFNNRNRINPVKFFGNEVEKVDQLCNELMHSSLSFKPMKERKEREDALLRALYGIAKRHHVRIEWLGRSFVCMPDRFVVYKNGKEVGMIQL